MKQRGIATISLVTGLFVGTNAHALPSAAASTPYQSVIDRNVFDLKPAPPPLDPAANIPPPPKIALVGIANMFGVKKAILKILDPPKAGQPPQVDPFVLSEGEAQQDIEVKEIDEKAGTVKIRNHGTAITLTFKDDTAKSPGGPAPAAPTPMPGLASVPAPRPFAQAAPAAVPTPPPVMAAVGSGSASATTPSVASTPAVGQMASSGESQLMPSRTVRTGEPPSFSHEEQIIFIEAQREAAKQEGDPIHMILPPTPLTPPEYLAPTAGPAAPGP